MLWEVEIRPAAGRPDRAAEQIASEAADLGLVEGLRLAAARGYLLDTPSRPGDIERLTRQLLADDIVEQVVAAPLGDPRLAAAPEGMEQLVYVLLKPGVMDAVAESALAAGRDFGIDVKAVRTFRKYWFSPLDQAVLERLASKLLANDAIEQIWHGPLTLERLDLGAPYVFSRQDVPICGLNDAGLIEISRRGQLSLSLAEMQAIQAYFRALSREPVDVELETLAQTWSEHCSHKTLKGRVDYRDESGVRRFENLLRETIFAATQAIRRRLGADDWCVSVFEDNAGVVRFDECEHAVFKVETHNHPSALEPYGGANTGLGGVIRDPLGTGLGARPVANTDVFCFAPPDIPLHAIPPGVLHPRRVIRGVVAGVRDYGNRMGIPTVNGAVYFDPRYLANPLVFCGTVGMLPVDRARKAARDGDHIVAVGGRTGRDGIHGATFSSIELSAESEQISGGAVQIGNAITEKMLVDVILQARDRGLYHAITDCGAGGFSSAVGEMGAELGAEVWLERAPLKYEGLSYTEIWISEAQERMVLAVPHENWDDFAALCRAEGVEATIIGRFEATGRLRLRYAGELVADLDMRFLHDGRPPVVREAVYLPPPERPFVPPRRDAGELLMAILGALNVASKEWIIRQYDHEVQGGSVVKPLVGARSDGPSDAAVVRPRLDSPRGLVIACGANPWLSDVDTYAMAVAAIDEAVRNCVAVGADPARIAILDNFCWGNTDRPEALGSLVRAALACHDAAVALETPFISGKDSLNNEFSFTDARGRGQCLAIPPTLLVSALGQIDDVSQAVTMDLKRPGNLLYQVGVTREEFGGSHLGLVAGAPGGHPPGFDGAMARRTFAALHRAIRQAAVRACHDLSEGGLAVALAEMAFAGEWGAEIDVDQLRRSQAVDLPGGNTTSGSDERADLAILFAESNSRFVCEVPQSQAESFEACLAGLPWARIGRVIESPRLRVVDSHGAIPALGEATSGRRELMDLPLEELKRAWQTPLRW